MFKNIFANTLSKTEKIIISVFLALFIIPEILWSPMLNMVNMLFFSQSSDQILRDSFLYHQNRTLFEEANGIPDYLLIIATIQLLGLFFSFLFFSFLRKKINRKATRWSVIISLLLLTLVAFECWGITGVLSTSNHWQLVQ